MTAAETLATAWPQSFTADQLRTYVRLLADIPAGELAATVENLARSERFRPSPADVRRAVIVARGEIPTGESFAAQRDAAADWLIDLGIARGARAASRPPDVHPAVLAAVREAGVDAPPGVTAKAYRDESERWITARCQQNLSTPPELGL